MQYESADGQVREVIWNSRDGVTPLSITARDERTQLTHVRWHEDIYAPHHVPQLGDRIFVDLTPQRARQAAMRNAHRFWNDPVAPASKMFASVEEFATVLADGYLRPGEPDLIVVAG